MAAPITTPNPVQSMLHPRSMILTPDVEPLPLYSRYPTPRDSDAASITSAAPSYRSDAPPYTPPTLLTTQPTTTTPTTTPTPTLPPAATPTPTPAAAPPRLGLPNRAYAPGFGPRARAAAAPGNGSLALANYNMGSWSGARGAHSKQCENVAARRAQLPVAVSAAAAVEVVAAPRPPRSPRSPLEDPQLVGEEAAARARDQRLYRERCLRGEEALRNENKGWDFMMAQMADWEERERSWMRFRESVRGPGRRTMLARRIGVGKQR